MILIMANTNFSKICPVCFSTDKVHHSRSRNIFEKILKSTRVFNIYRCHNCGWRGIKMRKIRIKFNFAAVVRYVFLILITYMLVSYFVKKMLE